MKINYLKCYSRSDGRTILKRIDSVHVRFITMILSQFNLVYSLTGVGADGRMITRFKFTTTDKTAGTVQTDQSRYQGTLLCIHLINMDITFTIFGKLECVTCLKRWTSLEIYWFVKWFVLYLLGPFNLWSGTPADQCLWAKPLRICIWLYHTLCL